MRILLSYSYTHFNPKIKVEDHKYYGSSASIIARTLYSILSQIGEVTYISSEDYDCIRGQEFDLFIGIANQFSNILQACKVKKSVYFAVNMHPAYRNKILKEFVSENKLSKSCFSENDIVNANRVQIAIEKADYILCVGNINTYNSYLQYGIKKKKIKILNYGVDENNDLRQLRYVDRKNSYLYIASEIGLRKGFDIVEDIFTNKKIIGMDFILTIIGTPSNTYYENWIKGLKEKLGNKLKYLGWIDSNSDKYKQVIRDNNFLVFPSLEEGQAGTVLDAISQGCIPILSSNTGVDFSPLGIINLKLGEEDNYNIILKALTLGNNDIYCLRKKSIEYYNEFHKDFRERFYTEISGVIKGELYPKISIILPIFNKEKTILPLLKYLDKACQLYENVEVHIIFDGCVDKTEDIVRSYYLQREKYLVTFETTPDIFEVKTNNIGLRKSTGEYCVILQDDTFIYDANIFFEAVNFLDKNQNVVILGGLAGVNFYPLGTVLSGCGQITMAENEVYWRQDEKTDASLVNKVFEVDACMRGPLFFRRSFIEQHGALDEIYAPLYNDDMDICFRARSLGYKVYCMLMDVENKMLTMAGYDSSKNKFFDEIREKNTKVFYKRWNPTTKKDYLCINRTRVLSQRRLVIIKTVLGFWNSIFSKENIKSMIVYFLRSAGVYDTFKNFYKKRKVKKL